MRWECPRARTQKLRVAVYYKVRASLGVDHRQSQQDAVYSIPSGGALGQTPGAGLGYPPAKALAYLPQDAEDEHPL
jgi:hypothetical protein